MSVNIVLVECYIKTSIGFLQQYKGLVKYCIVMKTCIEGMNDLAKNVTILSWSITERYCEFWYCTTRVTSVMEECPRTICM